MGLRELAQTHLAKRLLGLALLCGIIILGGRLLLRPPVSIDVVYELGPGARSVQSLTATYQAAPAQEGGAPGRMVLRKRYNYGAAGAPENEHHGARIPRGTYAVTIAVERAGGTETFTRTVTVNGEGDIIRITARR
ncbi:MAG TPA: hypothetical protein VGQ83_00815 [Polyangia bacterium]|jgi:hypothetical protein